MDAYTERQFGREGVEYFRESLAAGKTLASYLLTRPDLDMGKIVTYLPVYVREKEAKQFRVGGKLETPQTDGRLPKGVGKGPTPTEVPIPTQQDMVVEKVCEFLRQGEDRVCVFEEALARPGDACVRRWTAPIWTFNEEIYYVATFRDSEESIKGAVRSAWSVYPPTIGAMTALPGDSDISPGEIGVDELRSFADRAERIVIGAYDGEGFLMWVRRSIQ